MSDLNFNVPECKGISFGLETKYVVQGGGTSDYNELENKPTYEGITIEGDLTASDLGIATSDDLESLESTVSTLSSTVSGHTTSISTNTSNIAQNTSDIASNTTAIQTNASNISANTTAISNNTSAITSLQTGLTTETTNRENADIDLQSQIDALTSKSDVVDIVGTYAQLQAYDTSTLGNNDIVKVLEDSTHDNAMSYYRWSTTSDTWSYIGSEGAYYTKSESDSRYVPQSRTINGKALSSNINLTANDVGALTTSELFNDGLPIEYRRASYIKSNGNAYLDTGLTGNGDYAFDFETHAISGQISAMVTSHVSSSERQGAIAFDTGSHKVAYYWLGVGYSELAIDSRIDLDAKFRFYQDKTKVFLEQNGIVEQATYSGNSGTINAPLEILHSQNPNHTSYMWGYIYSAKIYLNDELIRNYVPCIRLSDYVAGVYDKVNDTFTVSSGDPFEYGDLWASEIDDYATKDYVTAYVDSLNATGTEY